MILMACALVLGLCQCTKDPEPESNKGIFISVTVENAATGNGSKHDITLTGEPYPGDLGKVAFQEGDLLYVIHNNQVSGGLQYSATYNAFRGFLNSDPTNMYDGNIVMDDNDYLYFVFASNYMPNDVLFDASLHGIPFALADMSYQKDKLFVLSYGRSAEKYGYYVANPAVLGNLSCTLDNQCALVEFKLPTATAEDVKVVGVHTFGRMDFYEDVVPVGLSPYPDYTGLLTLYNPAGNTASDRRWGILLAGTEGTKDVVIGNQLYKNAVTLPTLTENGLVCGTDAVQISTSGTHVTLSSRAFYNPISNGWIEVAKSNLQYDIANRQFSLMANAWTTVETSNQIIDENYDGQDIVSLFGWGAWGRNCTTPNNTSSDSNDYPWSEFDNTITLDGQTGWRTPTADEMYYMLFTKNLCYAATVNGMPGVILLSDAWTGTIPPGVTTPATATSGMESADNWVVADASAWSALESQGALFFPAAGYREWHEPVIKVIDWGTRAYYQTSSYTSNTKDDVITPKYLKIAFDGEKGLRVGKNSRTINGNLVRLVRDVTY